MDKNISEEMTVMFVDVAGSVELYSNLGDFKAHNRIKHFMRSMTMLIEHYQGKVVETIGDEIMCMFNITNNALDAACAIQENTRSGKLALDVRIGLHAGVTGVEKGRLFGDTVNVSARVVALSKAGQIMLSQHAYQWLSDVNKSRVRYFNEVYIKGKRTPYTIYEAVWDQKGRTVMSHSGVTSLFDRRLHVNQLSLRYSDVDIELTEGDELLLGRGNLCGLRVESDAASRIHATLKCQDGKLVLIDRSTNGTFVKTNPGKRSTDNFMFYLHHKMWMTTCDGVICLGSPVTDKSDSMIHFKCSYKQN
ncbi:MAG: adenylate/guanylate cyclase domain-containing protein [Betaproteobacteria bacterium]|nr:adenylate/guanylate cyclase domain-containing protein [Betaproteobacteria bacterium]